MAHPLHRFRAHANALVVAASCLIAPVAPAHPGSGIVVDRLGQVYFVDMVSGVRKMDTRGLVTHMPGQAFHWMAMDVENRLARVRFPSGRGWAFTRIGADPTLVLASDFPVAVNRRGELFFAPSSDEAPSQVLKLTPGGAQSVVATLAARATREAGWIKGLAIAPDGDVYCAESDAIRRIDAKGQVSTVVENVWVAGRAAPGGPELQGLAVAPDGAVYVAATAIKSVLKVAPGGAITVLPQIENAWAPTGVALFEGAVYVLEFEHPDTEDRSIMLPRVRKIAPDGTTAIIAAVTRR